MLIRSSLRTFINLQLYILALVSVGSLSAMDTSNLDIKLILELEENDIVTAVLIDSNSGATFTIQDSSQQEISGLNFRDRFNETLGTDTSYKHRYILATCKKFEYTLISEDGNRIIDPKNIIVSRRGKRLIVDYEETVNLLAIDINLDSDPDSY